MEIKIGDPIVCDDGPLYGVIESVFEDHAVVYVESEDGDQRLEIEDLSEWRPLTFREWIERISK